MSVVDITSQTPTSPSLPSNSPVPSPVPSLSTPDLTPIFTLPQTITDVYGTPMVLVQEGPFEMGSEPETARADCAAIWGGESCYPDWFEDEGPVHSITLEAYYIDQYEVTIGHYRACVEADVCSLPSETFYYDQPAFDNYPITRVNWDQADTYCHWREARLPTEAEWEKAARGPDGRIFPWGNQAPSDTHFSQGGSRSYTQYLPIGSFPGWRESLWGP